MDSWHEKLQRQSAVAKQPLGKGWYTYDELFEKSKFGHYTLRKKIRQAVAEGRMAVFKGTAMGIHGMHTHKIWYKKLDD